MNSDPAPGRSPGPPVDVTINQEAATATQTTTLNNKNVLDNNTYNNNGNSNNDNNVAQHVNNENVALDNLTYATATTTLRSKQQQQQIDLNHKNNLQQNHNNNNEPEINNSDRESLNDSTYRHLVESTKLYNHHNDYDNANEQKTNNDNNDDLTNVSSDNDNNDDVDVEDITSSSAISRLENEEDAINFQLTKANNYNSPLDDKQQHKNVNDKKTTNNYPTHDEATAHVVKDELQEQMTLHRSIDYSNTHEKLRQHTKTIPAISTITQQDHTSSTSLFPASPNFHTSSSTSPASSSSSTSTSSSSSSAYSSCHSDLNDFLNDVTVIEVDDVDDGNNNNDSTNTSSSTTASGSTSTSTLPPQLQGFKIQLQLYHDVFDASTAFGINCGLLYKSK